jgi:hypothetical protein
MFICCFDPSLKDDFKMMIFSDSLKTMRVLMIISVVLSGLSNVTALAGYECITLSSNNYKFRRRCARFSGFLIFLSGTFRRNN